MLIPDMLCHTRMGGAETSLQNSPHLPSGLQWVITHKSLRATIVEVGGGIRTLVDGDRDILDPYPADSMCDGARGTPLVPWPNRLEDGRYTFDGRTHQLPLTEPARGNAIHGLLRWQPWSLLTKSTDRLTVTARIHPQQGYPFDLTMEIGYQLADDGLVVSVTATNSGTGVCPYAFGQHPYLSASGSCLDECTLSVPAGSVIRTDDRQLPVATLPVDQTSLDFREPRRIETRQIDSAFTDLRREASGRAHIQLVAPDGAVTEVWQDEAFPFVEIFTGDTLAPGRRRRGLGVEPMTAPPNAFRTGDNLQRLEPGQRSFSQWGIRLP